MLKNYLKIAWRNLTKNKVYSFINIFGLAMGIAVCVLISRYVSHEFSYDEYHSKSDRIYRVTMAHPQAHIATTPSMILPAFKQLFTEVETGVRIYDVGRYRPLVIGYQNQVFEERSVATADSTLFSMFDFELFAGDSNTVLSKPKTVVISQETAQKYFGTQNPLGKSLEITGWAYPGEYKITGVMNIPENSHFSFDFFISMQTMSGWGQLSDYTWKAANFFTYIVLNEGAKAAEFEQKVNDYINENFPDNDFTASLELVMEPLTDIHLYTTVDSGIAPQGDIRYVLAALAIALLILLIACINYMNLATARSARRSREVGIRKVLGSDRRWLITQFYGEAALMTILAVISSLLLVELALPWFNRLAGPMLSIDYTSFPFWAMILGTGIFVTLAAGSYPALMLSSFKPSAVLKNSYLTGGGQRLRKFLVIFQFAASVFLIISTLVIFRQINFMQQKDLGYKQNNVLVLTAYNDVENRFETFRSELQQVPGFKEAAMASDTPTNILASYGPDVEGVDEGPSFSATGWRVSPRFEKTLNMKMAAGRSFTEGDFSRTNQEENQQYAVIVNEAAAAYFGMKPEELIGRAVSIGGGSGPIVGVIENFHFASLHRPIEPLFIFTRDSFSKLFVSFNSDDVQSTLRDTRAVWNRVFPQYPFEYEFLDQEYNALYQQEARAGNIFTSFTVLAVFIACLGLIGLAAYMVERRTKEIGIRKVLGASVMQVMALFTKDFLKLIAVGFLLAVPVAWYVMSRWLQNFAYRVDIEWVMFMFAALITIGIALLTISYQAVKVARLDPIESLRNE